MMKCALSFFTFYLLLLQVVLAQTTSLRRVRIEPGVGLPGTPYEVLALRNLTTYPLTGTGPSSWTAAIASGQISLTVLSSGCLIAAGTIPPTVAPTCSQTTTQPTTTTQVITTPAYSQSLAGPDGRFIYTVASGTSPTSTSLSFTGAPKTASDYSYSLKYESNAESGTGQGGISVNGGSVQSSFTLEPAGGGSRTVTGVLSLSEGSNTVTFTNTTGTFPYQVKTMSIVRASSTTTIVTSGTTTGGGSTTTTSSTAVAYNKPSFYSFNYLPLTTNPTWPVYDSRKFDGVNDVGYKVVMDNGQVRAEIWKNWGGSVAHISVSGTGVNLINQNKDKGRGGGLTFYRGGRTRQIESQNKEILSAWATPEGGGVGNNPIEIGDVFDNSSEVVAMGRNDTMTYVKTRLYNWAVRNDPTDMYLERWVTLSGKEVKIRWKVVGNRENDKTPYEARSQEMPNLYVNYPWRTAAFVGGDGNLQYLSDSDQQPFSIKEPWVAMVNGSSSSATGIGLHRSGMYRINQKTQGGDGSGEFDARAGYTNAEQHLQIDWNGQYYGDHSFYVGSVSEIRTWANAKPNPRNKLSWKFNSTNGRGYFWYHNAHDGGYPTPDTGVEIVSDVTGYHEINWPNVSIAASSVTNLYMRYKAEPGYSTQANIVVGQPGEAPTTEAAHTTGFTLICDNTWRTVTIPVSSVPGYGGTIARMRMANYGANTSSKLTIAWINTTNAEPTENGLNLLVTLGIALGMARQRRKKLGVRSLKPAQAIRTTKRKLIN